jgi:Na+/H+ antiporter NhaC
LSDTGPLRVHGGAFGALLPFAVFLGGVISLALAGAPDERGFWPVLLAALLAGLALARDRGRWAEAVLDGMSQKIVMLMVMAWLLAGVLASLMNASGFVDALVWLAHSSGLTGGGYVAAAFLICCAVSTSTGTSLGTILLCAPLLYPAGAGLGAEPAILMGAILGGATFGDNISPVSDTTIASATTQGGDLGGVVRSRMPYALPAAAAALLLFLLLGGAGSASDGASAIALGSPRALPMLAVPVLVIGLLLARRHLLVGLLVGAAAAVGLALALGLIEPAAVLYIDPEAFGARGLVVEGLERGVGVSIFTPPTRWLRSWRWVPSPGAPASASGSARIGEPISSTSRCASTLSSSHTAFRPSSPPARRRPDWRAACRASRRSRSVSSTSTPGRCWRSC